MSNGRILHWGPYEGETIDDVVEMDPEYILWAAYREEHGITAAQVAAANRKLNATTPNDFDHDDLGDLEFMNRGRNDSIDDYD